MTRKFIILPAMLALTLLLGASALRASSVLRFELKDLVDRADLIVHATVDTEQAAWDANKQRIWTTYTLTVAETIKGEHTDSRTCRSRGGIVGRFGQHVSGEAYLSTGTEYLLFLWKDKDEQYRVLGMGQGMFRVTREDGEDGKEATVVNSVKGLTIVRRDGGEVAAEKSQPIKDTLANLKSRVKELIDASLPRQLAVDGEGASSGNQTGDASEPTQSAAASTSEVKPEKTTDGTPEESDAARGKTPDDEEGGQGSSEGEGGAKR